MTKIGIIICGRYQTCGGGKCLRAMKEHVGGFARSNLSYFIQLPQIFSTQLLLPNIHTRFYNILVLDH